MLSGKGLSKKVKQMVTDINYFDFLIAENPKSEKAARFKYMNIESLIKSMEQWENNPSTTTQAFMPTLTALPFLAATTLTTEKRTRAR